MRLVKFIFKTECNNFNKRKYISHSYSIRENQQEINNFKTECNN